MNWATIWVYATVALDEADGICEDTAPVNALWKVDWNDDGDWNDSGSMNIDGTWSEHDGYTLCQDNGNWCVLTGVQNTNLTVLTDHDDWANIVYTGISDSDGFNFNPLIIAEDPIEDILRQAIEPELEPELLIIDPTQIQIPTGRPPGN
jgi:hypothetical protein